MKYLIIAVAKPPGTRYANGTPTRQARKILHWVKFDPGPGGKLNTSQQDNPIRPQWSPASRVPPPTLECLPMFSGNGVPAASERDKGIGVRGDSQQLREVKDLISRLDDVNKKLALPARVMSAVLV